MLRDWYRNAQEGRLWLWTDYSPAGLKPRQEMWSLQGLPRKGEQTSPEAFVDNSVFPKRELGSS